MLFRSGEGATLNSRCPEPLPCAIANRFYPQGAELFACGKSRGAAPILIFYKNKDTADAVSLFLVEREGFKPSCAFAQTDFESSCQNRTWQNLTEDNGRCENPENAQFSRLFASIRIKNAVKIQVQNSSPISPSSNGFLEKPIRIFDRTERFFAPKSRFWQCVKSTGYAGLHPKSCRQMPGRNQNCRYRQKYK